MCADALAREVTREHYVGVEEQVEQRRDRGPRALGVHEPLQLVGDAVPQVAEDHLPPESMLARDLGNDEAQRHRPDELQIPLEHRPHGLDQADAVLRVAALELLAPDLGVLQNFSSEVLATKVEALRLDDEVRVIPIDEVRRDLATRDGAPVLHPPLARSTVVERHEHAPAPAPLAVRRADGVAKVADAPRPDHEGEAQRANDDVRPAGHRHRPPPLWVSLRSLLTSCCPCSRGTSPSAPRPCRGGHLEHRVVWGRREAYRERRPHESWSTRDHLDHPRAVPVIG